MKLHASDVIATRNLNGSWVCTALIDNQFVTRVYYFYTKREAIRLFLKEVSE